MSTPLVRTGMLPVRVGLVLAGLPTREAPAFKYYLLLLNRLQTSFEFEFYEHPDEDTFVTGLRARSNLESASVRQELVPFIKRLMDDTAATAIAKRRPPVWPQQWVIASLARLHDELYLIRKDNVSLLALGHWDSAMAPPSAAEFLQVAVLRAAYTAIGGAAYKSVHLGTKGCVFDYTYDLEDTKFMTLTGNGVCSVCSLALQQDGFPSAPQELRTLLDRKWLGKRGEPNSPADTMARLGYNLFLARGFAPTTLEKLKGIATEEGFKELIKTAFLVLGAAALLYLGLKKP